MTFEDLDFDDDIDFSEDFGDDEGAPPEESTNRTFLILAGVIGGAIILTIICIVVFMLVILPQRQADRAAQETAVAEQELEVAQIIEGTSTAAAETAIAAAFTATPTETPIPTETAFPTATLSPTPVLAVATTSVPTLDAINATATALQATANFNALMLEATLTAQYTPTVSPSALPQGGFVDRAGLPALLGLAALLIVVIFLARRLRSA